MIIIGAGAAGCYAAIEIKRLCPHANVTIVERGKRPLAKVAITGGGRCNLTNSFAQVRSLEQVYPRGHRLMKKLFHHHSHLDTYRWFEQHGVRLVTQPDECVFPQSQDAMEIVNTLLHRLRLAGVNILTETRATDIIPNPDGTYTVNTSRGPLSCHQLLVTTGGQPSASGYELFRHLKLDIIPPLPSLFTFNIPDKNIHALMGTVVENVTVSLSATKFKASGPLLLTHWGMSGPAILKLSSYAARHLTEQSYSSTLAIRWLPLPDDDILAFHRHIALTNADKKLSSVYNQAFNARLWTHLLRRAHLNPDMRWKELSPKDFNRLLNTLTNDTYPITGKSRFKEEFVTCGGVALTNLSPKTLECKSHPGLFFAGEITDVDAITGGFNLQAAWTMAYTAAQAIAKS